MQDDLASYGAWDDTRGYGAGSRSTLFGSWVLLVDAGMVHADRDCMDTPLYHRPAEVEPEVCVELVWAEVLEKYQLGQDHMRRAEQLRYQRIHLMRDRHQTNENPDRTGIRCREN